MGSAHPHDSEGRLLPWPSWPPGREAPGVLELVRHLCNTTNRENGADRLRDAAGLDDWLAWEGRSGVAAPAKDLDLLRAIRASLHRLTDAHTSDDAPSRRALAVVEVASLLGSVPLRVVARGDGLALAPDATSPVAVLVGELAAAVFHSEQAGELRRLKSCAHCRWVVYDASKNRGGRWCSMGVCGGRENARAYRRRRAAR